MVMKVTFISKKHHTLILIGAMALCIFLVVLEVPPLPSAVVQFFVNLFWLLEPEA